MLPTGEKILFSLLILATAAAFLYPVYIRFQILRRGRPEQRAGRILARAVDAFVKVFLQRCTLRRERVFTGFMHVFIFYSALTFDTMTVNHTMEGFFDGFYLFGQTDFGLFFSLLVDLMAGLVLLGVAFFIIRRFLVRPKAYATTRLDSAIIYFLIIAVTLSFLYFKTFAIARHPESARLSFLCRHLAGGLGGLTAGAVEAHFHFSWWLHIVLVFGFIAYVPNSKYFHMFSGPINVFLREPGSSRELRPLDIEKAEVFGLEKVTDLTWKDYLDAFACMECGRCQDACPAFASDKPLSPKMIVFNLKRHLLAERKKLSPEKRADLPPLFPGVHSGGEIWTCTTCGACQNVCPVSIEHIRKIVGVRQSEVLMQSRFPQELNAFFRNLETNSNPWGVGFSKRADWAAPLEAPLLATRGRADYLLWVGCAGSFDEDGTRIASAMVSLLSRSGVNFAILGTEEKCCGDSARRLGQEYLFQTLAGENLGLFLKYKVKRIITFCPHGFNVFRHEYPKVLGLLPGFSEADRKELAEIEVIPHVVLLDRLVKEGRLRPKSSEPARLTFHDSCYYGRHNGIIAPPRRLIASLNPREFVELKNNRRHSFCCGAGGGLMWTEESLGRRINHLRTNEVIASAAEVAATSCPFCLNMLKEGLKDRGQTQVQVKDIAQLLAERL